MKIKIVFFLLFVLLSLWFFSWFIPILIPMDKKDNIGVGQITNFDYNFLNLSISTAFGELKNIGKKFLSAMPKLIKKVWLELYSLILRLWDYTKNIWFSYIQPFLENIWFKIKSPLSSEVEERKSIVKEEFRSEKESLIKEVKGFFSKINIPFKGVIEKIIK